MYYFYSLSHSSFVVFRFFLRIFQNGKRNTLVLSWHIDMLLINGIKIIRIMETLQLVMSQNCKAAVDVHRPRKEIELDTKM